MNTDFPTIPLFSVYMHPDAASAVAKTLASGQLAQGPRVDEFEEELQCHLYTWHGSRLVTVNSGTSALDLAFELLGIGKDDCVISTPMTCVATNIMLARRQAKIIWADVDPYTGLIDPGSIKEAIRKCPSHPVAIVTVDWAGASCSYDDIREASQGVPIVEDAAHAFGARYRKVSLASGVGGDFIAWSFQAIKHLTTGDGGCLSVPVAYHDRARKLRWFGYDRTKNVDFRTAQDLTELGFKYHMNDIAATIGLTNLRGMDEVIKAHADNAAWLTKTLTGSLPSGSVPCIDDASSWWLYTIHCDRRSALIEHLKKHGIQSSPVHRRNDEYSAIKSFARWVVPHDGVDKFAATELAIPVGWWLTEKSRSRIADAVLSFDWEQVL